MLNVFSHSQPSMSNMLSLPNPQEVNDLLNQTTIVEDSNKLPFPQSFTTQIVKKYTLEASS